MAKSKFDFVSITIVAACILALIFLIYKTINMYNQNQANQTVTTEQNVNDDDDDPDLYDKDGGTYQFDDEDEAVTDENSQSGNTNADNNPTTGNTSTDNKTVENTSSDDNVSTSNPKNDKDYTSSTGSDRTNTTSYSNSSSGGRYMVIAGSFRQKTNASTHASKLRQMGYDEAEVSIFNKGAYATVLVDRFGDKSDAKSLSQELKNKGVEAIVITKK